MSRPRVRALTRVARWVALVAAVVVAVPPSSVQPTTLSLTTVGTAKAVDWGDGVLWVLVLGSDARPGTPVMEGRTDAIQLVGINWERRSAVSIGIPRDSYVDLPGLGTDRINAAVSDGGDDGLDVVSEAVADLVGITPDLVLLAGFDGFTSLVEAIGEVRVESPVAFTDDDRGLVVRRGTNTFDAEQALAFARIRSGLAGEDLGRSANHQRLMVGVLQQLRRREDDEGFMEAVTLAAVDGLETDLGPGDLYRFAQAVTTIDPARTTACVIGGDPQVTEFGASVLIPDTTQAQALGADAKDDARLQGGCRD